MSRLPSRAFRKTLFRSLLHHDNFIMSPDTIRWEYERNTRSTRYVILASRVSFCIFHLKVADDPGPGNEEIALGIAPTELGRDRTLGADAADPVMVHLGRLVARSRRCTGTFPLRVSNTSPRCSTRRCRPPDRSQQHCLRLRSRQTTSRRSL